MEKKIDLRNIDPEKLDPKQEKELFRSLSDEEMADVAGGSYVQDGHVCGSLGVANSWAAVQYDFEVGTRVQVTRHEHTWASWSATIIDRNWCVKFKSGGTPYYYPRYKVHFDGYSSEYDAWYEQNRLYI